MSTSTALLTDHYELTMVDAALAAGVDESRIVLDPGLGFAKTWDHNWELIGHLRRSSDAGFSWSEYLLFNPASGYAWLAESDGHWSLSRTPERTPKVLGLSAYQQGDGFDHFQHYLAEVQHVLGEFYWKVKAGAVLPVGPTVSKTLVTLDLEAIEQCQDLAAAVVPLWDSLGNLTAEEANRLDGAVVTEIGTYLDGIEQRRKALGWRLMAHPPRFVRRHAPGPARRRQKPARGARSR